MVRINDGFVSGDRGWKMSVSLRTSIAVAIGVVVLGLSGGLGRVEARDANVLVADGAGKGSPGGAGNGSGKGSVKPGHGGAGRAGGAGGNATPEPGSGNKSPRGNRQGPGCPYSNQQLELIV